MSATKYSEETVADLCAWIADGKSMRSWCRKKGNPNKITVQRWLNDSRYDAFRVAYLAAQVERAAPLAEETLEIADQVENCENSSIVQAARVRIDTRKWFASRMDPKRWGDRVNLAGVEGAPVETKDVSNETLARWMAFVLRGAQKD